MCKRFRFTKGEVTALCKNEFNDTYSENKELYN